MLMSLFGIPDMGSYRSRQALKLRIGGICPSTDARTGSLRRP